MSFGKYDSEFSALKSLAHAVGCTTPEGGWDSSYSIVASMYEHLAGSAADGDMGTMIAALSEGVESGEIAVTYDCSAEIERLNIVINQKDIKIQELQKQVDEGGGTIVVGDCILDTALASIGITQDTQPDYINSILNGVSYAEMVKNNWSTDILPMIGNKTPYGIAGRYASDKALKYMPQVDSSYCTDMIMTYYNSGLEVMCDLDYTKVINAYMLFSQCSKLTVVPDMKFTDGVLVDTNSMFDSCISLSKIPTITGTSGVVNFQSMYRNTPCTEYPEIDTTNAQVMSQMYQLCSYATSIPNFTCAQNNITCDWMLSNTALNYIPSIKGGTVAYAAYAFDNMWNLIEPTCDWEWADKVKEYDEEGNVINENAITNWQGMFEYCYNLTKAPTMDSKGGVFCVENMFEGCSSLTYIPDYDMSGLSDYDGSGAMFGWHNLENLTDLDGFTGWKVTITDRFLNRLPNLTVESVMNVINKLEDVSDNPQTVAIGSDNMAKLTEEQIAVATAKGWTLI